MIQEQAVGCNGKLDILWAPVVRKGFLEEVSCKAGDLGNRLESLNFWCAVGSPWRKDPLGLWHQPMSRVFRAVGRGEEGFYSSPP